MNRTLLRNKKYILIQGLKIVFESSLSIFISIIIEVCFRMKNIHKRFECMPRYVPIFPLNLSFNILIYQINKLY